MNISNRSTDLNLIDPNLKEKALNILKTVNGIINQSSELNGLSIDVFEALRTQERQDFLRNEGSSRIKRSKHQDGKAVDFVVKLNGKWTWNTKDKRVLQVYQLLGKVAKEEGLVWGGDWIKFVDMPHVELKD